MKKMLLAAFVLVSFAAFAHEHEEKKDDKKTEVKAASTTTTAPADKKVEVKK